MKIELSMRDNCLVVLINDRYFYKYSKNRCLTAWCLAGAKHFMPCDYDECVAICEAEKKKGKECYIIPIRIGDYHEFELNQMNLPLH